MIQIQGIKPFEWKEVRVLTSTWSVKSSSSFKFSDLKAAATGTTCTLPEASGSAPQEIDPAKENEVLFTYSVQWEVSDCSIDFQ